MKRRPWGLIVGCAMTALGCAGFATGLFDRLDAYGLDVHFRWFSGIESDPRIILIDINDHALQSVGEWPWARRQYARLVETLSDLGAEAIVLDLVLSEPSPPRSMHAGLGPHYDVDTLLPERGNRSADPIIYDDDELREAMIRAGNVYPAMFFRLSPPGFDREAMFDYALRLVLDNPRVTLLQFEMELRDAFHTVPDSFDFDTLMWQARIAVVLEGDFGLDESTVAQRLDASTPTQPKTIETHWATVKRIVARRMASRFFADTPSGSLESFLDSVLPGAATNTLSADRDVLIRAYRSCDAFLAISASSVPVPEELHGRIAQTYDPTLPVEKFALAARGVGFVSFERERQGGIVREIPLLADADGVLVPQLGLLAAMDLLGADCSEIGYDDGQIVLGHGANKRSIPMDRGGATLINWHVPIGSQEWQDSFDHVPVTRVLEIALNAEAICENESRLGLAIAELVELRHANTPAAYADYVRLVNRRLALRDQKKYTPDSRDNSLISSELSDLDNEIERIEDEAVVWLQRVHGLWEGDDPQTDEERTQHDRVRAFYSDFGEGQLEAHLAATNTRLAERSNILRAELRPRIEGKTCLVGYTASGVADLVTSPVFSSMPGVMAHANIANMVLQDRPAMNAPTWVKVVMLLVGGIVITLITCARGPLASAASLLVLAMAVLGGGALTFRVWVYHSASLVTVAEMCVVWGCVTSYRQFIEERGRRQVQRALAQYTSPAVAARITSGANVLDLAPQPVRVTCFFSDLYGFTHLSERLGPGKTQLVLNPYLRAMSRVLVDHGAIVNKFMGDGIFAFFNSPIWPCENHSEAACACALSSLEALEDLNRDGGFGSFGGRAGHTPLRMRIGLSTGEVFVGDYGSDTKLDYTCIGDTVNLASRLEQANKILGTNVLVNETTRLCAPDQFVFRTLGRIEVPGRTQASEVWELIGLRKRADSAALDYLSRFKEAVQHYQACEWDRCEACLEECRRARPNDRAVQQYRHAVARHRNSPPASDWNKAISLFDG